jgi:hypothetical protein
MIRVRTISKKDFEVPVYDMVDGSRFPISVKAENWYNGYAIGGKYHISLDALNALIDKTEKKVTNAVFLLVHRKIEISRNKIMTLAYREPEQILQDNRRKETDGLISAYHKGQFASDAEFLNFISNSEAEKYLDLKRELGLYEKNFILDHWDDFISTCAPASYNHSKKAIQTYISESGDNCIVTAYDDNWLRRYFNYLGGNGYLKGKGKPVRIHYASSTLRKYLKHMHAFGNYLFEKKIITTQNYRRFRLGKM